MKRWFTTFIFCSIFLLSSVLASEALVQGQAYIISSINVDPSELITTNQKYSLVPQVVVYDGTTEYVGSVTKFTGCYNGKLYDESVQVGSCFFGGLATATSDGLMSKEDKAKLDRIAVDKLITSENISSQSVNYANSSGWTSSAGNADTVDGYHADGLISTILNRMYPVNSIYFSASSTNPYYTFGFGSWELIGTKLAISEHVFGNGYGLGMHSVDGNGNTFLGVMTGGFSYENVRGPIGLALGASTSTQQANGSYRSIGVATKADLGSNLHYSGLVVDTATIYSWKRTG